MDDMRGYIGTKLILTKTMTRGEYNEHRGWKLPEGEKAGDEGYLVQYEDGYQSWSPKDVFEKAYREYGGMTFGLALEAAKKGHRVARRGWNGKGMYVFLCEDVEFHTEADIGPTQDGTVYVRDMLALRCADGSIQPGWLASQSDMLEEDWMIVGGEAALK